MASTNHSDKPKNTSLSDFYGLPSSSKSPEPSSPSPLSEALELTKTLTLPSLLNHSAQLHQNTLSSLTQLHESTRQYYSNLSSALSATKSAAERTDQLTKKLSALSSTTATCASVTERLSSARKAVDKLDGARRATLLKSAAVILAAELEPSYRSLADLCTDPEPARQHLFVVARRVAVVLPAVKKLGENDVEFQNVAKQLDTSVQKVRDDIRERGRDPYALGVVEGIRLRRLLGESEDELMNAYLQEVAEEISNGTPKDSVIMSMDKGSLAGVFIEWVKDIVVPRITEIEKEYASLFSDSGWETFIVWMSDFLDETIAARMRKAAREGDTVENVVHTIEDLAGSCEGRVRECLGSMIEGLRGGVICEMTEQKKRQWSDDLQKSLSDDPASIDGLIRLKADHQISWTEICQEATELAGIDLSKMGRLLLQLRNLRTALSEDSKEVEKAVQELTGKVFKTVMERVEEILLKRMSLLSTGPGSASSPSEVSSGESRGIGPMVKQMQEADEVGRTFDIRQLCIERGEQDFLLVEDDGLVAAVQSRWMEIVKSEGVADQTEVHVAQLDAKEVGIGIGVDEAFAGVAMTALECCKDKNARLLSESQVTSALQKRADQKEVQQANQ